MGIDEEEESIKKDSHVLRDVSSTLPKFHHLNGSKFVRTYWTRKEAQSAANSLNALAGFEKYIPMSWAEYIKTL